MTLQGLPAEAAGIVLAAGKGSRMRGYEGNKTLLPLVPVAGPFEGHRPLLLEVLENLPPGPKGIVVHHRQEDIRRATRGLSVHYIFQSEMNGTGGALLAARSFLETAATDDVLITMGDVPLIRPTTYRKILRELSRHPFAVLAFEPRDKAAYGVLELEGESVARITEWKYWRNYPQQRRNALRFCNAGVYGAKRAVLLENLDELAARPHTVEKERDGAWTVIREYFLTDLVEILRGAGRSVGFAVAEEDEVMGVDTPEALARAQNLYARRR